MPSMWVLSMLIEQSWVRKWIISTFGKESMNPRERSLRFLEEAIELVQAIGAISPQEALRLHDKVWNKLRGETKQEVGGVFVTFLALCEEQKVDAFQEFGNEMSRIHQPEVIARIRMKQAQKLEEGF